MCVCVPLVIQYQYWLGGSTAPFPPTHPRSFQDPGGVLQPGVQEVRAVRSRVREGGRGGPKDGDGGRVRSGQMRKNKRLDGVQEQCSSSSSDNSSVLVSGARTIILLATAAALAAAATVTAAAATIVTTTTTTATTTTATATITRPARARASPVSPSSNTPGRRDEGARAQVPLLRLPVPEAAVLGRRVLPARRRRRHHAQAVLPQLRADGRRAPPLAEEAGRNLRKILR